MSPARHSLVAFASPRLRSMGVGLALLLALLAPNASAQRTKEYDLKAVFLFNFATFVEWPEAARPASGQPFKIGILGDDPFGETLDEVVRGEAVGGSPLQIVRARRVEDVKDVHILFVSNSEAARVGSILAALRNRPVLTVGDSPRFVDAGGMVGFSTGAHLQLHVNPEVSRGAGLVVSSKLLRVARLKEGGAR